MIRALTSRKKHVRPYKKRLWLRNVFFKVSESEHSDREFYYSGELLDTEMLQLPTHTKATERKSFFRSGTVKKLYPLIF